MSNWLPKRDSISSGSEWSSTLGVWFGSQVRAHITLVLLALITACAAVEGSSSVLGLGLLIYLASLLLHEAAHWAAASRVGGGLPIMILGPFGGLEPPRMPREPKACVFVAMAGPLTHLAIVVLGASVLAQHNDQLLPELFLPVVGDLTVDSLEQASKPELLVTRLAVLINWPLFLLNLLPAYPFDGAAAFRALLAPRQGDVAAQRLTHLAALIVAATLIVFTLILHDAPNSGPWITIIGISLSTLLVFGANRDAILASENRLPGANFDRLRIHEGFGLLEAEDWNDTDDDTMVLVEIRRNMQEDEPSPHTPHDEDRVDSVLEKLHDRGIDHLTPEERSILEQASEHYRRRRDS